MKKYIWLIMMLVSTFCACAGEKNATAGNTAINGDSQMKISIRIDNGTAVNTLTATLADNSSAKAFYTLLQKGSVTVDMHDYGSFEKVGPLPQSLPRNDTQITTTAGDIILYQGNQITIYYDRNSWTFTRLGKVDNVTQTELKKILGNGNVTAVFAVKE